MAIGGLMAKRMRAMQKLKIGIVGLNFGQSILEEVQTGAGSNFFELAAVCDLDDVKARTIAERNRIKAYFNLDDLLNDKDIAVIGLFTPPKGRAGLIESIIKAGKDVITTKPFELDGDKALEVLRKAGAKRRVIHLNSPSPLMTPDLLQIKEWVNKYELGRAVACRCDVWSSYREKSNGSWYDDPERCPVAPIFRIGIYLINDLVRLFGEAEKVQVLHSKIFTGRPTPDNAQLGVLFKNGAICNVFASFCIKDGQYFKNSLTINYENGTVYRNVMPLKLSDLYGESIMQVVTLDKQDNLVVEQAKHKGSSGEYQWDVFYRAISGENLESEATPEEIVEGIKIINAMARAEKTGCSEYV